MARLSDIVPGEGAHAAAVVFGAFLGRELHGAAAGLFEFAVRHLHA